MKNGPERWEQEMSQLDVSPKFTSVRLHLPSYRHFFFLKSRILVLDFLIFSSSALSQPPMNKTENGGSKNILVHKLMCDLAMRPMNEPEQFCIKNLKTIFLKILSRVWLCHYWHFLYSSRLKVGEISQYQIGEA